MTEIAIRPDDDYTPVATSSTIESLAAWAHSAKAAHGIATSLVTTSFVPEAFRGKAAEATAAILAGAEVGLSPMAALRSFDIIQGVAAPRANTLRAVVQSQGHDVWVVESTEARAVVEGRRRNSTKTQRSTWTIQRAQKLGLTGKKNWQSQPQAMLVARATAECCRLIASDAILGLPYALEEIADGAVVDVPATDETPAPKRTARRAPLTPVPEPDLEPEVEPEPAAETDQPEAASREQIVKLNLMLKERGVDDRDDKLAYLGNAVGREIGSSNDLTRSEAHSLIDAMEREPEPTLDPA